MMNLFEKLNRLDDSLVESKRVVNKKKLTEGYRVEPKISKFNIGDRVAERYNDSEFNVGTIIEIKKDAEGIQYLVKWDYSDREDKEWLYGDVLSLWVEDETEDVYDDNIDEMLIEGSYDPYPAGKYGDLIFKILDSCSGEAIINFMYEYKWPFYESRDSMSDVYDKINKYLDTHSGYGLWSDLDKHFN